MRVNLTYNDNIKIFDDVARHVELEEDRLLTKKMIHKAFMTESKSWKAQGFGCNKNKGLQGKRGSEASYSGQKHKKRTGKKNKNKNCFNCGKLGYFALDCTEPKVMFDHNSPSNIYVSSFLLLAETVSF